MYMKRLLVLLLLLSVLPSACQIAPDRPNTESMPETIPLTEPVDPVDQLLNEMTLEEKVGQLFLVRYSDSIAIQDVTAYHLSGFVLFGKDFKERTRAEVTVLTEQLQAAAQIPLLIAVDEEGGTVTRVSTYSQFRSTPFPSPRELYQQGGLELIGQTEEEKCKLLSSLGINVNLAPVCDITTDPKAFMYDRSFGQDPKSTGQYIKFVVDIMNRQQIGSVLKHFPGYGNNADTHTGIAIDDRTLEELVRNDLVPFISGIQADCGAIMVSHTFVNCLDRELPASLSPQVHRYLREQMYYNGVIATDDLDMQAITDLYGHGEAAVLAVQAGNDLLCCTEYSVQYEAVLEAVQSGRIPHEQIDQSVRRILNWKSSLGLLQELPNSKE